MQPILINNFADFAPLEITCNNHVKCGPLVSIMQSAGSLRFQHSMTPSQARDMAAALLAMADAIEKVAA